MPRLDPGSPKAPKYPRNQTQFKPTEKGGYAGGKQKSAAGRLGYQVGMDTYLNTSAISWEKTPARKTTAKAKSSNSSTTNRRKRGGTN